MTSHRTITSLAVALAVASLALPGAALARGGGGGGGGGTTPPPVDAPYVQCDYALDGLQADGSTLFSNQANRAGCVTVRSFNSTLRLYSVALTPGWTYVIKSNGEGTSSRVALQFTETATGQRVDFLTEFGKTKIS